MAKRAPAPSWEPRFSGFPSTGFDFLRSLRQNNSKDWFDLHRETYQTSLRQPLCDLVTDLAALCEAEQLQLTGDAKRSLFRINRDVRFSHNKSPYNCHVSAALSRSGSRKDSSGGFYIHLEPEHCFAATGFFQPGRDDLTALREDIVEDPKTILKAIAALQKRGHELDRKDSLKRLPRGFDATGDETLDELLRLKSFIVFQPLPDKLFTGPNLLPRLRDLAVETAPLRAFGNAALDLRDANGASP
jgi:uncharacterized protein (TIGR02453 family)